MPKRKNAEIVEDASPKKPNTGFWANGLLTSMEDPSLTVKTDDLVVVIRDKYPKAEFHYLVLCKENISNLKKVTQENVELLEHMNKVASDLVHEDEHKGRNFKIGYHAEPSMVRLHLHVISDDMNSACVKTKKHWNSFNTEFFLDAKEVLQSIKENGKIELPTKEECKKLMETSLKCHKCDFIPKHMPDLKKHILRHSHLEN